HETVGAAGRTFADVAERCDASLPYDDPNRWRALARPPEGYAAGTERLERADRDLGRIRAVARNAGTCGRGPRLTGIAATPQILRSIVRLLLRARPDTVRIPVHAPESEADRFDELGCVIPRAWIHADIPLRDEQLSVVGHPSNQATEVARHLAGLSGELAADEIVI